MGTMGFAYTVSGILELFQFQEFCSIRAVGSFHSVVGRKVVLVIVSRSPSTNMENREISGNFLSTLEKQGKLEKKTLTFSVRIYSLISYKNFKNKLFLENKLKINY